MKISQLWLLGVALLVWGCGTTIGDPPPEPGITIYDAVPHGSIVITEVQANPNSGRPQYLEFKVTSDDSINLKGCQLVDAGSQEHSFSIAEDLIVEAGEFFLAGESQELIEPVEEGGVSVLPVKVHWPDITLSPSDPEESISLNCPDGTGARHTIDSIAFDWEGLEIRRGHSWQINTEIDADANDDPANWCVAPSHPDIAFVVLDGKPDYGTPLAESICIELNGQPISQPGEVVINEILIDEFSGLREWFEIYNPTDQDLDLLGCELGDAAAAEPEVSQIHTLSAEGGETIVPAGGFLLFAKSGFDITDDASALAHYSYSSVSFNNSDAQLLWIDCPSPEGSELMRVDAITYNWSTFGSDFEGRSLVLDPLAADAESNDDPTWWCLSSSEEPFWSTGKGEEVKEAWGTPGEANENCPIPDPLPLAGEMVFTEVLARSAGAQIGHNEEWIELRNLADHSVSLDQCLLLNEDDGGSSEHLIEPIFGLSVAASEYLVLVRSSAADSLACGLPADYSYGNNISFNNAAQETLSLLCGPEEERLLIDSITFDGASEGFEPGLPRQLLIDAEDAAQNDDATNWCVGGDPASFPWSCSVGEETNYGTPGSASNCP